MKVNNGLFGLPRIHRIFKLAILEIDWEAPITENSYLYMGFVSDVIAPSVELQLNRIKIEQDLLSLLFLPGVWVDLVFSLPRRSIDISAGLFQVKLFY